MVMVYKSAAGQFFPKDLNGQKEMIGKFLANAKDVQVKGIIKGLIVPHAGWMYSGIVAASGYQQLKLQISNNKLIKDKIILVGPSHKEYFLGIKESVCDHSVEVQIPFIKEVMPGSKIISLVYGDIKYQDLSAEIKHRLTGNSVIIVSSDLSHYYPYETAKKTDNYANNYIPKLDIENTIDKVEACGITGILALLNIAKETNWKGELLDYKNSGDTAGDKDSVVGYGCYAFYEN